MDGKYVRREREVLISWGPQLEPRLFAVPRGVGMGGHRTSQRDGSPPFSPKLLEG
jgi:hypothetical protein